ncbi:MAG TPA: PH domain-containing protein [Actinophytocola sp.]|uniref:PH domain-containing protein n=1 Tax=Actinophytocola sp. TaxID=1872138 RepID=UPI002DDD5B2F|nr:PH domain-containing protein [Actinophytocola sp.]HEV2780361.1 PH domain-containing protein [Actinophytocola sp.]
MDNSTRSDAHSWAPRAPLVGLAWVLAAAATGWVILTDDLPGRVLLAVAAIGLALLALFGTVARPRLTADAGGVTVRNLTGRRHWGWGEVNVRLVHTRRLGRDLATVELDAEDDLVVLGWFDLGADPVDVVDAIRALRT